MDKILVVGHSHIAAIRSGLAALQDETAQVATVYFKDVTNAVEKVMGKTKAGLEIYTPEAADLVFAGRSPEDYALVVSAIGGNLHNVVGFMEHPVPFDFDLTSEPDLPRLPGVQRVTYGYMMDVFTEMARPRLAQMRALRNATTGRVVHVESPPPNGDDRHVSENLDKYFRIKHDEDAAIAPRILRYKLWRLHSEMVETACREMGVEFIPVPRETQDNAGFLIPRGYSNDATHGNSWYGRRVVKQIQSLAEHAPADTTQGGRLASV